MSSGVLPLVWRRQCGWAWQWGRVCRPWSRSWGRSRSSCPASPCRSGRPSSRLPHRPGDHAPCSHLLFLETKCKKPSILARSQHTLDMQRLAKKWKKHSSFTRLNQVKPSIMFPERVASIVCLENPGRGALHSQKYNKINWLVNWVPEATLVLSTRPPLWWWTRPLLLAPPWRTSRASSTAPDTDHYIYYLFSSTTAVLLIHSWQRCWEWWGLFIRLPKIPPGLKHHVNYQITQLNTTYACRIL